MQRYIRMYVCREGSNVCSVQIVQYIDANNKGLQMNPPHDKWCCLLVLTYVYSFRCVPIIDVGRKIELKVLCQTSQTHSTETNSLSDIVTHTWIQETFFLKSCVIFSSSTSFFLNLFSSSVSASISCIYESETKTGREREKQRVKEKREEKER